MEIQFAIVRSENAEYLCYKEDKVYADVSNPMMTFTVGEDAFEVVNPDTSFMRKECKHSINSPFHSKNVILLL